MERVRRGRLAVGDSFPFLILDVEELGLVLGSIHKRSWRFILKASFLAYVFSSYGIYHSST